MATTTFSGPIKSGDIREGSSKNTGDVVLSQTAAFSYTDTGAFASGIILPANSQIVDIKVKTFVAWDSVTSDALEIGTLADPDAYADVTNLKATAGVATVAQDVTQLAAVDDIGTSDVPLYLKITSVGGSLSQGSARITVLYVQNNNLA